MESNILKRNINNKIHKEIYLKIYGQPIINLTQNKAYIFELTENTPWTDYYKDLLSPGEHNNYNELYTPEVNIINKIKINEDGYFDFSKNMIDIGANVFVYSFILPFNFSYCFEPNDFFINMGKINMSIHNKDNKYKIFNTILSDKEGEIIQYDGFTCLTNNTVIPDIQEDFNKVNMVSSKLDSFELSNIGFIKIDVEGYEYKVLKGGINTIINNNYPPILFELWDIDNKNMTQEKHDELKNFIENLGYEILWYWGDYDTHLAIHK